MHADSSRRIGFIGTSSIGMLLVAIWFLLTGLIAIFGLNFSNSGIVMGVIALIAGIFLLIGR